MINNIRMTIEKEEQAKEFNLSEKIWENWKGRMISPVINVPDIKEFIKRLLTPNNISKGFVEISTIKYYAGDKLI